MIDIDEYWHLVPDKEALEDLSAVQAGAILRLMIIGTFADDEVTVNERLLLAQAVINLPHFDNHDWTMFNNMEGIQVMGALHDRYEDKDDFIVLLGEIRDALGGEPMRIVGLRMMALLMRADEFRDDEYDFCLMVGQALGLEEDVIEVVTQDAALGDS